MITMTRQEAIQAIRMKLLDLVDDEHSMCRVASEKGIYCRGFRKLSDEEMNRRHDWLRRNKPDMTREQLEDFANRWQLARQIVDKVPISCDVQSIEHDTCGGWESFDNATLARFHQELSGVETTVTK